MRFPVVTLLGIVVAGTASAVPPTPTPFCFTPMPTMTATLTPTPTVTQTFTITPTRTATTGGGAGAFQWAKGYGGPNADAGRAVAVDNANNVIFSGQYNGAVTFGAITPPCAGSSNIPLVKLSPGGTVTWAKCFGSTSGSGAGQAVATDQSNNIVIGGYFIGPVDFGGTVLTSTNGFSIFVAKYDPSGNLLWAKGIGTPDGNSITIQSALGVATDASGNVIVTGRFSTTANFGGGPVVSNGGYDVFVAAYTPGGSYLWAQTFGSPSDDFGSGVAVQVGTNTVVATGAFTGTVNLAGACGSLVSAGSTDIFLATYNPSGSCVWAERFGSTNSDQGKAVTTDSGGNIAMTGSFQGTVNFGNQTFTASGGEDIFFASYTSTGAARWSRAAGGSFFEPGFESGTGIHADASGNVAATGYFFGTADFGTGSISSSGSQDIFVAKYSLAGTPLWARGYGGTNIDQGFALTTDSANNVLFTGQFTNSVDFGGGPITSQGSFDVFLTKLGP